VVDVDTSRRWEVEGLLRSMLRIVDVEASSKSTPMVGDQPEFRDRSKEVDLVAVEPRQFGMKEFEGSSLAGCSRLELCASRPGLVDSRVCDKLVSECVKKKKKLML